MKVFQRKTTVVQPVFAALLFLALAAAGSPCLGNPRMGPDTAREITRIIHTNSAAFPLPPGWEIKGFSFTDLRITVTLKNAGGDESVVGLSYPWGPVSGVVAGKTLSFRLEIIKADSAGSKKAALDFFQRIKRNDSVYFFSSDNMIRRESWSQFLFQRYVVSPLIEHKLVFASFIVLIFIVLVINIWKGRRFLLPKKTAALLALAIILLAGLALRLYVSPSAPIHCNSHGIEEVRIFIAFQPSVFDSLYGRIFPAVSRLILGCIGPEEKNLFLMNQVFGTFAILGIFIFAKGLTESDTAGILSALFLSVSPAQVWLSGTESQISMYQCIGLSGLGFLCLSSRTRNIAVLWAATIMIAFASSLRILTVFIIPIAILTGIYMGIHKNRNVQDRYAKHHIPCLAVAVTWGLFHYLSIPNMTGKGWSETNPLMTFLGIFFDERVRPGNTIFDPTLTPFIVPLAAAAAYYYSWKKNRRFAIYITAAFLIAVPLTFSVLDCRTTAVRYQTQGQWVYYILASALFAGCGPEIFNRKRTAAVVAVAILAAAGSVPGLAMLYKGDEEINEYRFIRKTAVKIPQKTVIRLPVDYAGGGRLITDYPDYINNHIVVKGKTQAPKGHRELIYVGLDCYRYKSDKEMVEDLLPNGKRKQCVKICPGRLVPLHEKKLDARMPRIGYHQRFHLLSSSKPVVGFYECIPDEK